MISSTILSQEIITQKSYIRRKNGTTYGSTNTAVVIYSTAVSSVGTDISYTNDSVGGDYFTINTAGIYTISATGYGGTSNRTFEINIGSSVQNTFHTADVVAGLSSASSLDIRSVSWTGWIDAGKVIYTLYDQSSPPSSDLNNITIVGPL